MHEARKRAHEAARELSPYPDRLLRHPCRPPERRGERWWSIGHIRLLGQPERWDVLYDPETDDGRMQTMRKSGSRAGPQTRPPARPPIR
jgi:hypothetical protein